MTDVLVVLCVGLVIACMVGKDSVRRSVGRLQGEIATLKRAEQATEYERRQNEAVLVVTEGRERELKHDRRQLTKQLVELQAQIEEVEARSAMGPASEDDTDGMENHS